MKKQNKPKGWDTMSQEDRKQFRQAKKKKAGRKFSQLNQLEGGSYRVVHDLISEPGKDIITYK